MKYMSLFSGIEAATVAWQPLGWECVAVAEIEPFPAAVLAHHYPAVPNLGDVTNITSDDIAALGKIDLVVFGSPCQDLSVAGKRLGFDGERSGLFTTAIRIVQWAKLHCGCRFALWENVPGAFSSNKGRDFATVVEQMAGCRHVEVPKNGWGTEGAALGDDGLLEWSTLDAQWFGVAQRRRRVFALADFGGWASRRPILLEPDSLRGDSPPSREQGKEVAPCLSARTKGGGGLGTDFDLNGGLILAKSSAPPPLPHVAMCLNAGAMGRQDAESETLIPTFGGIFDDAKPREVIAFAQNQRNEIRTMPYIGALAAEPGAKQQTYVLEYYPCETLDPCVQTECAHTQGRNHGHGQENVLAYGIPGNWIGRAPENGGNAVEPMLEVSPCQTVTDKHAVAFVGLPNMQVRRLTPTECERLQGFPDRYSAIPWRGKPASVCPDGPRYKALGNSMAVPVMRWIGRQIENAVRFEEGHN